jgi:hypothetical protein
MGRFIAPWGYQLICYSVSSIVHCTRKDAKLRLFIASGIRFGVIVSSRAANGHRCGWTREKPMSLPFPEKSGASSLEAIARNGSTFRRIAARIPTYLSDIRENPPRLIMQAGFGVFHPSRRRFHGEPVIR